MAGGFVVLTLCRANGFDHQNFSIFRTLTVKEYNQDFLFYFNFNLIPVISLNKLLHVVSNRFSYSSLKRAGGGLHVYSSQNEH